MGSPRNRSDASLERPALAAAIQPGGPSLQVGDGAGVDLGETRRLVTVLFADLSGSTSLGEQLDPEDLRRVLGQFFSALAREIRRYGGTVDKYIGDAIMAVFGAPVAHEDDAERAISAAIAMHAALDSLNHDLAARYGRRLALRIGINTGQVVAGLLAGDVQAAYTVVGDTVNIAQRFEAAAEPGTILVGQGTRELTRRSFEFEALAPLQLKGKAELQPAFRVLGARMERSTASAIPLVGRERELGRLRQALGAAAVGSGGLVHLVGEAGIGKSRLVRELRASVPAGVVQIVARCVSFESEQPYALLARLVRDVVRVPTGHDQAAARQGIERVLGVVDAAVDPLDVALLLEILGYGEHGALDPQARQHMLLQLMRRLLPAYAEHAPLLIVAEDLHWADAASMLVLAEVARAIPSHRCLLVSTSRPGAALAWEPAVLPIDALPPATARSLVELAFGTPVDTALADTILRRTGGNPLFIEEVVRGLHAADVLVEPGSAAERLAVRPGASPSVPATVQEVLEARLDRLSPELKHVVQASAVCGRVFRARVVQHLLPEIDVAASLRRLARERFIDDVTEPLQPEPTFAFSHALIQEVAYNRQLHARRRLTHAAIGETLELLYADRLDEQVADLAFHFGSSANDDKARHWLVRSGDRARGLYANTEALKHYRAALDRATDGLGALDAPAILERIGAVEVLTGSYDAAVDDLRFALSRMPPVKHPLAARLRRRLAEALLLKGAYAETASMLDEALDSLPDPADPEAAHIRLQVGQLHYRRGAFEPAHQALQHAVDLGLQLGIDDLVAQGLKQMGNVALERGDLAIAQDLYTRSRAMYERLEDPVGLAEIHNNLGIIHRRSGRWAASLAEYEASLALCRRMGHLLGIGRCYNNLAEVHRTRGDPARAIPAYQQAIETWSSIGHALFVGLALVGLGAARVETGDVARGRADLLDARARFAAIGSSIYLPDLYRYLASAELASGQIEAAEAAARRSLEYARAGTARHQEAATLRILAEVALARGDPRAARRLLSTSRDTLRSIGDALELTRTEALLASIPPDAATHEFK